MKLIGFLIGCIFSMSIMCNIYLFQIEKQLKDKEMGEDDKFRLKTELQKMVDDAGMTLEDFFNKKEKEISE